MRVLLTEAEHGDAIPAAHVLGAAGHALRYCHPPDDPEALCGAVAEGARCPLLQDAVDVLVDVRWRPIDFTPREQGAICAMQRGTPLVICGPLPQRSTLRQRVDAQCASVDRLEQACAQATEHTSPTARRAIAAAVRRVLGIQAGSSEVRLLPGRVVSDVVVTLQSPLPAREHHLVQSTVRFALMPYTPLWRHVKVITRGRSDG